MDNHTVKEIISPKSYCDMIEKIDETLQTAKMGSSAILTIFSGMNQSHVYICLEAVRAVVKAL